MAQVPFSFTIEGELEVSQTIQSPDGSQIVRQVKTYYRRVHQHRKPRTKKKSCMMNNQNPPTNNSLLYNTINEAYPPMDHQNVGPPNDPPPQPSSQPPAQPHPSSQPPAQPHPSSQPPAQPHPCPQPSTTQSRPGQLVSLNSQVIVTGHDLVIGPPGSLCRGTIRLKIGKFLVHLNNPTFFNNRLVPDIDISRIFSCDGNAICIHHLPLIASFTELFVCCQGEGTVHILGGIGMRTTADTAKRNYIASTSMTPDPMNGTTKVSYLGTNVTVVAAYTAENVDLPINNLLPGGGHAEGELVKLNNTNPELKSVQDLANVHVSPGKVYLGKIVLESKSNFMVSIEDPVFSQREVDLASIIVLQGDHTMVISQLPLIQSFRRLTVTVSKQGRISIVGGQHMKIKTIGGRVESVETVPNIGKRTAEVTLFGKNFQVSVFY